VRAASLVERRRPLELADLPDPAPGAGEVVIQVEAEGICRTDWHVGNGDWAWVGLTPTLPLVLGHELGGTVVAVGPGVSALRAGDRVTTPFHESWAAVLSPRKGGRLVQVGLTSQAEQGYVRMPLDHIIEGEIEIVGSVGNPHVDYPRLLALVETGVLRPARIVGQTLPLERASAVLDAMDARETLGFSVITEF
jgi:D-arabinose 1-dehydrogenase-like Zn-dependent alcohol dehydrogenase